MCPTILFRLLSPDHERIQRERGTGGRLPLFDPREFFEILTVFQSHNRIKLG